MLLRSLIEALRRHVMAAMKLHADGTLRVQDGAYVANGPAFSSRLAGDGWPRGG
jgi:hypothetical protein